jgi:tetratricopeptide (TPR) repeat protein
MGRANESLNRHAEALACFRKVNTEQLPWVFNEIGFTNLQLNRFDSAAYYLKQVQLSKNIGKLSIADIGINKLYYAELHIAQQQYLPALDSLQQAIIVFAGNFRNRNIYTNPSGFIGTFAYLRLFSALSKKRRFLTSFISKAKRKSTCARHWTLTTVPYPC